MPRSSQQPKTIRQDPTSSKGLRQKFHDYLANKLTTWVLRDHVDEGNPSWLKWDPEDKRILEKVLQDPKSADLEVSPSDTRLKKFIQSVIQNGFNTGDVQMFYRYRDQLPLRQLHWSFDMRDFDQEDTALRSNIKLPAGFYMVEIQIRLPRFSSRVPLAIHRSTTQRAHPKKLMLNGSAPAQSDDDFAMNLVSHRMSKRLIWLREDGYLDLVSNQADVFHSISHLKLARCARAFFVDRMMRRMGQEFDAKKHGKLDDEQLDKLWRRYDQYFVLDLDAPSAMHQNLNGPVPTAAARNKQITDLAKWLKRNYR